MAAANVLNQQAIILISAENVGNTKIQQAAILISVLDNAQSSSSSASPSSSLSGSSSSVSSSSSSLSPSSSQSAVWPYTPSIPNNGTRQCVRLAEPNTHTVEQISNNALKITITLPYQIVSQYAAQIPNVGPDTLVINYTDYQGQAASMTRSVIFTMTDAGYAFISQNQGTQFLVAGIQGPFFDSNWNAINTRNKTVFSSSSLSPVPTSGISSSTSPYSSSSNIQTSGFSLSLSPFSSSSLAWSSGWSSSGSPVATSGYSSYSSDVAVSGYSSSPFSSSSLSYSSSASPVPTSGFSSSSSSRTGGYSYSSSAFSSSSLSYSSSASPVATSGFSSSPFSSSSYSYSSSPFSSSSLSYSSSYYSSSSAVPTSSYKSSASPFSSSSPIPTSGISSYSSPYSSSSNVPVTTLIQGPQILPCSNPNRYDGPKIIPNQVLPVVWVRDGSSLSNT